MPGIDDSTRYLVAAAHLDREYAEDAVREFLVEPTRQVPPSPGIDTPTVLAEALAARTRRKYRDALLAVLGAGFVYCSLFTGLLTAWLAVAFVLYAIRLWRKNREGSSRNVLVTVVKIVALGLVSLPLAVFTAFGLFAWTELSDLSSEFGYDSRSYADLPDLDVLWAVAICCALAMLVVLVVDRIAVWHLLTTYFGRSARIPGGTPKPPADRLSFSLAPPRFRAELQRHRVGRVPSWPDAQTPLIVHRGANPFVGAGESTKPWSTVIPLTPDAEAGEKPALTARLLYRRIAEKVAGLRDGGPLAPDCRLRDLTVAGRVFAPADKLLDHLHLPEANYYLRHPNTAPEAFLHDAEAGHVHDQAREWSRYYLCMELETWDRDLVVSAFVHCAVGANELYVEWTPCVLPPIADEYRDLDKMVNNGVRPLWEGFVRWLLLPVTSFGRIANAFRMRLPLPHDSHQLNPDRYGTGRTLRELASMRRPRNYFQTVDAERYVRLLESRLVPAVAATLQECGYSSTLFERRADARMINNITISGTNNAPMIFGGESHGDISGPSGSAAKEARTA
ncbi:hypothetical protein [Amycolatopsis sp. WGS_07]|uniref:hypothetical protein n=1 Tax=Amycolatopsis sp. WGS_07 TaxID=3076764 RepID=UPI0038739011